VIRKSLCEEVKDISLRTAGWTKTYAGAKALRLELLVSRTEGGRSMAAQRSGGI
jgi:hypothetical protein